MAELLLNFLQTVFDQLRSFVFHRMAIFFFILETERSTLQKHSVTVGVFLLNFITTLNEDFTYVKWDRFYMKCTTVLTEHFQYAAAVFHNHE